MERQGREVDLSPIAVGIAQVELEKAIAENDWATVQRLRTEMQEQFGLPAGPGAGFNRGGQQGGQGGQGGQGRQGGQGGQGRQGGQGGQGRQGGQGGGQQRGGNNAGGGNNAPAPAPAGWN